MKGYRNGSLKQNQQAGVSEQLPMLNQGLYIFYHYKQRKLNTEKYLHQEKQIHCCASEKHEVRGVKHAVNIA